MSNFSCFQAKSSPFMTLKHKSTFFHKYTPFLVSQPKVKFIYSKPLVGIDLKRNRPKLMTVIELMKTSQLEDRNSNEVEGTRFDSTINQLSQWIASGLLISLTLWRHDAKSMWALTGSVINAALNVTLKKILKQERPVANLRPDPGMPSSHAQSIFYIVMFVIQSILEWQGNNELSLVLSIIAMAFASYLSWLRVTHQFHTITQVWVGAILGAVFSMSWQCSWNYIVEQTFDCSLWVKIFVYLGASGFWIGFILHVIRNWFQNNQSFKNQVVMD